MFAILQSSQNRSHLGIDNVTQRKAESSDHNWG